MLQFESLWTGWNKLHVVSPKLCKGYCIDFAPLIERRSLSFFNLKELATEFSDCRIRLTGLLTLKFGPAFIYRQGQIQRERLVLLHPSSGAALSWSGLRGSSWVAPAPLVPHATGSSVWGAELSQAEQRLRTSSSFQQCSQPVRDTCEGHKQGAGAGRKKLHVATTVIASQACSCSTESLAREGQE